MSNFTFKEKFKLGTLTQEDIENMVYICESLENAQNCEKITSILDSFVYSLPRADFNGHLNLLENHLIVAEKNPLSIGLEEIQEMRLLCKDAILSLEFNFNELSEIVTNVGNRLIELDL